MSLLLVSLLFASFFAFAVPAAAPMPVMGDDLDDGEGDDSPHTVEKRPIEVSLKKPRAPKAVVEPEDDMPDSVDEPTDAVDDDGPQPDENTIPADMIAEAVERGFSEADAKDFGSPQALKKAIIAFDRNMSKIGRSITGQQQPQPQQQPQVRQPQYQPQPSPSPQTSNVADQGDDISFPWNEAEVDPEIVKGVRGALKTVRDRYESRIAALENVISQTRTDIQSQQLEQLYDRFDNAIAQLPDEYRDILGSGSRYDIEPGSEFDRARKEVWTEFFEAQIPAFMRVQASNQQGPLNVSKVVKSLVRRAANAVLADRIANQSIKRTAEKLKTRQVEFAAPPASQSSNKRLSPKERATARLARMMGQALPDMSDDQIGGVDEE